MTLIINDIHRRPEIRTHAIHRQLLHKIAEVK